MRETSAAFKTTVTKVEERTRTFTREELQTIERALNDRRNMLAQAAVITNTALLAGTAVGDQYAETSSAIAKIHTLLN